MSKKIIQVISIIALLSAALFFFIKKSPIVAPTACETCTTQPTQVAQHKESKKTTYTEIQTPEQLQQALNTTNPFVIKFYANWCGACNYVNEFYPELAQEMPHITFYSLNVDNQELMKAVQALTVSKEGIEYLPTFVVIQPGKVHTQFTGGRNKEDMKKTIQELLK